MRYLFILSLLLTGLSQASAQTPQLDSAFQKLAAGKDEDGMIEVIVTSIIPVATANPSLTLPVGERLLQFSRKNNSKVVETCALSTLGQGYRLIGNQVRALHFHHKARELAEQTGNHSLISICDNQTGHVYKDREENDKAIQLYQSSLTHALKGKSRPVQCWPLFNIGAVYLNAGKLDSALIYTQRAYELTLSLGRQADWYYIFQVLGGVHSKMGNPGLAMSYLRMGLANALAQNSTRYKCMVYTAIATHFQDYNQKDSVAFYAGKALAVVSNSPLFYMSAKPARLMAGIYEKTNCDSSLKYANILKTSSDSLTSNRVSQQVQLMTFEEDLRQQDAEKEKQVLEQARQQNIQYALLALGIMVLLIFYLVLSRSFITNIKTIEFMGVIALLIVFEFLNLLLHPFLEKITYHSPPIMLLALVCIAALLVPLHHKTEKWAIATLVDKNKKIRLAAAKKTIEELG